MPVLPLPPHIVHHIAAGEVIEKPVSVIKELIENAIDANAKKIEVDVEKSGLQSIKVSDNGSGISKKDCQLLFTRYATSKLKKLNDLLQLSTHGFRGEALFSIMSVADVEVFTRHKDEREGTKILTQRGVIKEITPIGHRIGSSFSIRNLFHRMPVRKKTILPIQAKREIKKMVDSYAITYPEIAFSLILDGKIHFISYEGQSDQERMLTCWKIQPEKLVFIEQMTMYGRMLGWISKPEFFATHSKHQLISVNKRPVISPEIKSAIESGLQTFRHAGKYPQYVVHLELNPNLVDANIHPQKSRVKILHHKEISNEISQAVTKSFQQKKTKSLVYTGEKMFPILYQTKVADDDKKIEIFGEIIQMELTYLLAQTNEGFILVDQHAADEKLWYNRLQKEKKLLKKIELNVSQDCQRELDDDLYQHSFADEVNSKIATISCHQAIRAGQQLSQTEAKNLIQKIIEGGNETLTCPHGRPTFILVSLKQVEQLFRRR